MFWLPLCLLVACLLCLWLKPNSELAYSAARAFDSSVLVVSRGRAESAMLDVDDGDDENIAERRRAARSSATHVRSVAPRRHIPPWSTAAIRKRVTPLMQKRVAARYNFKCAICNKPFTDTSLWEVDHIVPLSSARTAADVERLNSIENLQPVHRTPCHQMKTSREAAVR